MAQDPQRIAKFGAMTKMPAATQTIPKMTRFTGLMPKRSVSEPMMGWVAMFAREPTDTVSETSLAE